MGCWCGMLWIITLESNGDLIGRVETPSQTESDIKQTRSLQQALAMARPSLRASPIHTY